MTTRPPPDDLAVARLTALEAARNAARLCVAVRAEMPSDPAAMEKAGREPVTIADYGAQAIILHTIVEHFPQDSVLAEEHSAEFDALADRTQQNRVIQHVGAVLGRSVTVDEVRRWLDHGRGVQSERVWAIDPIDGTKGFLRSDQFAVAVALIVSGQPVVSALACPMLPFHPDKPSGPVGLIALAVRSAGAMALPLADGPERPLRVSPVRSLDQCRAIESMEHSDHEFSTRLLAQAGVTRQPLRMDSQAKYAAVADARAEIYIRQSKEQGYAERVWDHAAGALIAEEAGGRVTDLDGKPLDFSTGERMTRNRGVLATAGPPHEALLAAVQALT